MVATPTVKQRRLARKLKEARLAAGLTHAQAADALGCKQPKISKIENAIVSVNSDDVRTLAETFGMETGQVEALAHLARQAKKPGWWHIYLEALLEGAEEYIEIEADAITMCNYEADVIPGLLQTEDYARSVIRVFAPETGIDPVEKRTELRMRRQERLVNGDLTFWAVVDAGALTRVIGSKEIHLAQLLHLLSAADLPNVTFQVLPPEAGEHMALGTPFACFEFEGGAGAVVIDHLAGTLCIEDEAAVGRYRLAFQHLRATALNARDSLAWVRRLSEHPA